MHIGTLQFSAIYGELSARSERGVLVDGTITQRHLQSHRVTSLGENFLLDVLIEPAWLHRIPLVEVVVVYIDGLFIRELLVKNVLVAHQVRQVGHGLVVGVSLLSSVLQDIDETLGVGIPEVEGGRSINILVRTEALVGF